MCGVRGGILRSAQSAHYAVHVNIACSAQSLPDPLSPSTESSFGGQWQACVQIRRGKPHNLSSKRHLMGMGAACTLLWEAAMGRSVHPAPLVLMIVSGPSQPKSMTFGNHLSPNAKGRGMAGRGQGGGGLHPRGGDYQRS